MAEIRECAQCGTSFTPRREHARFCTARCRMAWNCAHGGVAAAPGVAIDWSVIAMAEAAARFTRATEWDLTRATGALAETVWWITLIDATLVRYQPREYEHILATLRPGRRRKTEETLTGLRYVRNQLGGPVDPALLIRPFRPDLDAETGAGLNSGPGGLSAVGRTNTASGTNTVGRTSTIGGASTISGASASEKAGAWMWNPLPEPDLAPLPDVSRDWELSRYRAYQARLADRDVARVFARCAEFLERAATAACPGESLPAVGDAATY
jgi:hypothetical protein